MEGKPIFCKAAVAWGPKQPLDIVTVEVAPPKKGEIRVKVISNALCHTDIYTLDGHDPEGIFPCILGHEACAVVESIGEGVTTLKIGDIVIPCYMAECQEYSCIFCRSEQTNLCPKVRNFQGKGVMTDGTSRFSKDGKPIFHFMGCSTMSEYTVINEIQAAKIHQQADPNQMCMLGCGLSTGWGAVYNNCKVKPDSTIAVFGLGAVGLSVIQACKLIGAKFILGVDINESKFQAAKNFGAHECINPLKFEDPKAEILKIQPWGYDFTFDATGNTQVMRQALEVAHRGWGQSCVIGVAAAGQEIQTRPFQLVTGRVWKGTAFGGWKSRTDVPKLVQKVMLGELPVSNYVSNVHLGLEHINTAIHNLHEGKTLRDVVQIDTNYKFEKHQFKVLSSQKQFGGVMKRIQHWSESCQSQMVFSIYLPENEVNQQRGALPNVLYYLAGLTCTDEQGRSKSNLQNLAKKHNIACVFPDTSPRGFGLTESWEFGEGASFYLDATNDKYKNFQMYTYITKELPELVKEFFPVGQKMSITGHSMGGHGALVCALRNPALYESCSAFAPICNPSQTHWGQLAFATYLDGNGENYDAYNLIQIKTGRYMPLKIDLGTHDEFRNKELSCEKFVDLCHQIQYPVEFNIREGYDHSYYFISTFAEDHLEFHAKYLK